jgi:hypothetical protein
MFGDDTDNQVGCNLFTMPDKTPSNLFSGMPTNGFGPNMVCIRNYS